MQITLNTNEVSECVLTYVKEQLGLDDTNNFVVELHEDGITVLVNEEGHENEPKPAGEKPARQKRQPRKPKETPPVDPAAQSAALGNAATSTQTPVAETPAAQAEAAGVTTQEPLAPGEKDPSLDTALVVEQPAEEPVVEPVGGEVPAEEPAADPVVEEPVVETPPVKPTQSLFANLRKPNNG